MTNEQEQSIKETAEARSKSMAVAHKETMADIDKQIEALQKRKAYLQTETHGFETASHDVTKDPYPEVKPPNQDPSQPLTGPAITGYGNNEPVVGTTGANGQPLAGMIPALNGADDPAPVNIETNGTPLAPSDKRYTGENLNPQPGNTIAPPAGSFYAPETHNLLAHQDPEAAPKPEEIIPDDQKDNVGIAHDSTAKDRSE